MRLETEDLHVVFMEHDPEDPCENRFAAANCGNVAVWHLHVPCGCGAQLCQRCRDRIDSFAASISPRPPNVTCRTHGTYTEYKWTPRR